MADSYQVISTVSTVELTGGGGTVPGAIVTARAVPSGASFSLFISKTDLVASHLQLILPTVAEAVNQAADLSGVAGLQVYQDVNSAGQFVNKLEIDVTSTSGQSSDTISPPYGGLFDNRVAAAVKAAVANLDAIENL